MIRLDRLKLISLLGVIVVFVGCLVLLGWQFDISILKSLMPGLPNMNPVTASTFIICGIWLFSFEQLKGGKITLLLWGIVMIIGLIHFITYYYSIEGLRMDNLFYGDKVNSSLNLSLIAPNTALVFMFFAITMATTFSTNKIILLLREGLIFGSFWISYISIIGYAYGIQIIYHLSGFTSMALPTSFTFLLISLGFFLTNISYGFSRMLTLKLDGSRLLRRTFIFILVLPILLSYIRLLGERKGLYTSVYGIELQTIVFTLLIFILLYFYSYQLNIKQRESLILKNQIIANETKYRKLINSLKEAVASIDYDGRVTYCNPSYCEMLGFTEEELIGNVVVDMIIPISRRTEFYERLSKRKNGLEENYETEVYTKTGEKILIDIKSRNLMDENGKNYAYVVSCTDITEEKLKIEDLKAFSASAAHDLNSPLSRIQSIVEILKRQPLEEEMKKYLSIISTTTTNMKDLLHNLLEFSRLGTQQLVKQSIALNTIVQEICKQQTPSGFNGTIIQHTLPDIIGNEGAIKQAFTNLISNAIKYSSKTFQPKIEIGSYKEKEQTFFFVKDNGVGLNEEQLKQLFTPFKRFHNNFEGNGMGLAIVKRVIEKHGGTIYAESTTGEGVNFYFTLSPDT